MTREEAIAILQSMIPTPCRADGKSTTHTLETIALEMAIKALEQTEPERKLGKWIWDKRTGTYQCSECGHDPLHEDVGELEEYKYCMNCGAKMVVDG